MLHVAPWLARADQQQRPGSSDATSKSPYVFGTLGWHTPSFLWVRSPTPKRFLILELWLWPWQLSPTSGCPPGMWNSHFQALNSRAALPGVENRVSAYSLEHFLSTLWGEYEQSRFRGRDEGFEWQRWESGLSFSCASFPHPVLSHDKRAKISLTPCAWRRTDSCQNNLSFHEVLLLFF